MCPEGRQGLENAIYALTQKIEISQESLLRESRSEGITDQIAFRPVRCLILAA